MINFDFIQVENIFMHVNKIEFQLCKFEIEFYKMKIRKYIIHYFQSHLYEIKLIFTKEISIFYFFINDFDICQIHFQLGKNEFHKFKIEFQFRKVDLGKKYTTHQRTKIFLEASPV